MTCQCCPFGCGVDRVKDLGVCKAPAGLKIAKTMAHHWEEPCLSGTRGSGAVFFSHCNASCLFCQNHSISQGHIGQMLEDEEFLDLCEHFVQTTRVHNLNLVSPTHYSMRLIPLLPSLRRKVRVPIVWNSNGYESLSTIESLAGLVEVFLPDLKFMDEGYAVRYSRLPRYFHHASRAILAMKELTGPARFDADGLLQRGLIIRHLILPGGVEDSQRILSWIAENLGTEVHVSLMSQYTPTYRATEVPALNRRVTWDEVRAVQDHLFRLGFENGFVQDLESSSHDYIPDFKEDHGTWEKDAGEPRGGK